MNSEEKWTLVDDWQWDALSGTMQEFVILLGKERADLLAALEWAVQWTAPPSRSNYDVHADYLAAAKEWAERRLEAQVAIARAKGEAGQ